MNKGFEFLAVKARSVQTWRLMYHKWLLCWLLANAVGLSSCALDSRLPGLSQQSSELQAHGLYAAAAFGPDGTLWRVTAGKRHIYVDHSGDRGKTFSVATVINPDSQRIKASAENRPSIAVDSANMIYVTYPAEGDKQPAEVYFSVSADGGKHFSSPAEISDQAAEANTLQGTLALSPHDRAYVFWHDERDRSDWRQIGNALYYTTLDAVTGTAAPSRKAADVLCECCKIAASFDADGQPVAGYAITA
jgi:hypothetical protein